MRRRALCTVFYCCSSMCVVCSLVLVWIYIYIFGLGSIRFDFDSFITTDELKSTDQIIRSNRQLWAYVCVYVCSRSGSNSCSIVDTLTYT